MRDGRKEELTSASRLICLPHKSVDVLDALLDLPEDVQAIVVGDTPGLSEWAANQEDDAVKTIEVHAFV